jgi:hypothetical protein
LPRLDLLKIDVEGHEAEVLAAAADTLTRLRPVLISETADETVDERADRQPTGACRLRHRCGPHHYSALSCSAADYRAAAGACAGAEARNLLALPHRLTAPASKPAPAGDSRRLRSSRGWFAPGRGRR